MNNTNNTDATNTDATMQDGTNNTDATMQDGNKKKSEITGEKLQELIATRDSLLEKINTVRGTLVAMDTCQETKEYYWKLSLKHDPELDYDTLKTEGLLHHLTPAVKAVLNKMLTDHMDCMRALKLQIQLTALLKSQQEIGESLHE